MIHNASQTRGSLFATSAMVKMGMLAAIGMVLMLVDFPLPLFPSFLQIDLSDVPAVIGAFSLGPAAGVVIELLKNLLKLIVGSNTGGVGELANFLVGGRLCPASGLDLPKVAQPLRRAVGLGDSHGCGGGFCRCA